LLVHGSNSSIGLSWACEGDEAESSGSTGVSVTEDDSILDDAKLIESALEGLLIAAP